jgi:membrane-associated phospholipid phosphatase
MWSTVNQFDLAWLGWLRGHHAPWLDLLMSGVTIAGIMAGVWHLAALAGLLFPARRADAFRALLTLWLALLVVDTVVKPAFARERPVHATDPLTRLQWAQDAESRGLVGASDSHSFPSGHATTAIAGAMAVSRVWPEARGVWWTLALLIAYSRIYLGHHYPTDVIAGAVLGAAVSYWVLGGWRPPSFSRVRAVARDGPPRSG